FVDEGIPLTEPGFGDLEADTQRAIVECLKDAHSVPRGPLPPVVFRETNTGKFQPLPEVKGKGKEKVGAEQATQVLLNLQTPKKKSQAEQYIFQRHEEIPPVVKSGDQDEGRAGPDPGASGASASSKSPAPPPPPSNNQGGQSTSTAALSSSKIAASAEYTTWTMTDTRIKPSVSPIPEELHHD
ncbi:hypothetical protein Tco_1036146, partial [Tanacetum coccineum]